MIEIEGLTKKFGAVEAVKDLSLVIPSGELFCFLGPNGAGKTTTIKMLCGLLHPTAGGIRLDGIDILAEPEEWRRRVGYIPDNPFMYERLTPAEFLEFIGDLYGIAREEVSSQRDFFFGLFRMHEYARHRKMHPLIPSVRPPHSHHSNPGDKEKNGKGVANRQKLERW